MTGGSRGPIIYSFWVCKSLGSVQWVSNSLVGLFVNIDYVS